MTGRGNFASAYLRLIDWIRCSIFAEQNPARILAMARFYAEVRRSNHDGIYHDDEVERAVELRVLTSGNFPIAGMDEPKAGTVLLASEVVDGGGHSAVILQWMMLFRDQGEHRLLVTGSISPRLAKRLKEGDLAFRVCSRKGIARIDEIVRECGGAERIVLHIHPEDIEAAIAARLLRQMGKQILFYNHADHVFSYGISSAERVCEISSYGAEINAETGRTTRGSYLGIPIDYRDPERSRKPRARVRTVLSGGQAYKYAPGELFFGDFVGQLLARRSDIRVLLAGSTGREPWWCSRPEAWADRVVFLGQLARDRYMEILDEAEIYVDSFPVTGGTAFPEALLGGALVAGLRNPVQGYSPVDGLRVPGISALVERVIDLLNHDPEAIERNQEARKRAEQAHSPAQFRLRVEAIYRGQHLQAAVSGTEGEDIHWLSRKWASDRKIVLPSILRLLNLPLGFCLRFGIVTLRSGVFVPNAYRARIALAVLLKLVPVTARSRALATFVRCKRLVFAP